MMPRDLESTDLEGAAYLAQEEEGLPQNAFVMVFRPCVDCGLVIGCRYTEGAPHCADRQGCRERAAEQGDPEVVRVDGDALCPDCSREYRAHPLDQENLSGIDGIAYLHIGCDGRRLKT
jgi:hypothetical protein